MKNAKTHVICVLIFWPEKTRQMQYCILVVRESLRAVNSLTVICWKCFVLICIMLLLLSSYCCRRRRRCRHIDKKICDRINVCICTFELFAYMATNSFWIPRAHKFTQDLSGKSAEFSKVRAMQNKKKLFKQMNKLKIIIIIIVIRGGNKTITKTNSKWNG